MSRNVRPLDCFPGPAAGNEDTDLTKVILTGTCLFFLSSKSLTANVVDFEGFVDVFFLHGRTIMLKVYLMRPEAER